MKRLAAIAQANYVFDCLSRLDLLRGEIRRTIERHDPAKGDNAERRDCAAFDARLAELALGPWLAAEARLAEFMRDAHNGGG